MKSPLTSIPSTIPDDATAISVALAQKPMRQQDQDTEVSTESWELHIDPSATVNLLTTSHSERLKRTSKDMSYLGPSDLRWCLSGA